MEDVRINTSWLFGVSCDQLTADQCNHISSIAKEFSLEMAQKYANGQVEHGGNLFDMTEEQLLDEAIKESIDHVVYLFTIRQKLRGVWNAPSQG